MEHKPDVPAGGLAGGREPQQQGKADESGSEGRGEQRHGGDAEQTLADELQDDDEERQQRQPEGEPGGSHLDEAGDVEGGARARHREQEAARHCGPSGEGRQRQRRGGAVQRQRDEVKVVRHGSATRRPIAGPASGQEGIFLTRRTGIPRATSGFATPMTRPEAECSRV